MAGPLRAFLWLRWRLAVNSMLGGRERDLMASSASWASLVVRLLLGLLMVVGVVGLAVVTGVLARSLVSTGMRPDVAVLGLRVVLGALSLVVLFFPLVTRSSGDLATAQRLRLLPLRQRHLDGLDTLGAFADPWLLTLTPVPLVMALVLVGSAPVTAAVALVAGVLLLVSLALSATGVRRVIALVLRDRRRAEAAAVILIVGIMLVSMGTMWLDPAIRDGAQRSPEQEKPRLETAATEAVSSSSETQPETGEVETPAAPPHAGKKPVNTDLRDVARSFPLVLQALPSELVVRAMVGALERRPAVIASCLLGLGLIITLLRAVNRRLWRATVGSPGVSGRTRGRRLLESWRLPGLSPAATAVAWVQMSMALRTIAGKLSLVVPTLVMLLMAIPLQLAMASEAGFAMSFFRGPQMVLGGVGLAILSLQPFTLNQFAADGDGFARQILLPLGARDLLLGKAAGLGILSCVSALMAVCATAAVLRTGSPGEWLALLLTVLPVYLLLAPVSAALSLYFPKAMNLGGLGSKSKPHQLATLIALVATAAVFLPAALLVGLGTSVFGAPWLTALAVLVATAAAALVNWIFFRFAADSLRRRREAILAAVREG